MTTTDESALPGLLKQMIEDIKDPQCGYWLYSNYFDVLPPTDRNLTRWWQAPLYIDYDALWNPVFEDNAMLIDVILKNKLPAEHERIRIEYAQIWSLKRFHHEEKPKFADDWILYNDSSKLKMPPLNDG
ncbi:hypothetical protein DYU11_31920 [Fibrisoma montanum]|uniref:Uncharacterized protein n=1 Tax=Fibrisoma montanum TaxID=2305895 RepID=A0A418LW63_9BACT|nr:hypothetical protein [Fibrisoma montanum]RIV17462.1 hypothetical protein DYU11_31920 [Fibrisoma montanum]